MMDDIKFKAILEGEISSAIGYIGDAISSEQTAAMDAYYGQPQGDEREGRSQVIDRTVMDTVEQTMPSLMRIFTASPRLVNFVPNLPDPDVMQPEQYQGEVKRRSEAAEQATDYCNHIFWNEANSRGGFCLLYDLCKDALIQKVGIAHMYWDTRREVRFQIFEDLDEDEYAALLDQFPDAEVVEETKNKQKISAEISMPDGTVAPIESEEVSYDCKLKFTREKAGIRIEAIPPEEFIISRHARSIDDPETTICGWHTMMSRTELLDMGFDPDVVNDLPGGDATTYTDETNRGRFPNETWTVGNTQQHANERIETFILYVRVDYDGDDIAEIRRVVYAGKEVLENIEVERVPFYDFCPIPVPHRFFGMSLADITVDLQTLKTTLWRQMLDNLYFTNTPEVVAGPGVKTQDLARRVIGGVIRTEDINQIKMNSIPFTAQASFPMMEYVDDQRKQRTGTAAEMAALNPEALKRITAEGVREITSMAQSRPELIARVFAETGFKRMFNDMRKLLREHQDFARVVNLRGGMVRVDPSMWPSDMACQVEIGIGHGSTMEKQAALQQVMSLQQTIAGAGAVGGGMVKPSNIYASAQRLLPLIGVHDITPYFNAPSDEPPPPAPSETELKMQLEQKKAEMDFQLKQQEMDLEQRNEVARLELKRQEMIFKLQLEERFTNEKIRLMQADAMIADENQAIDRDIKMADLMLRAQSNEETSGELKTAIQAMNKAIGDLKGAKPN